jgi:hypothetical protein
MPTGEVMMIPGILSAPSFPLKRYRSHQVSGHLDSVIRTLTEPGELVLEINTPGSSFISESLVNNRRILAQNIDPISMLINHVALNPVEVSYIRAALTHLGDSPKGDQSLRTHINEQYLSKCPVCNQQGIAAWFAWDRDTQQPFLKCVHCVSCGEDREGPADEDDALDRNLNPTTGLAYHVALERAASHNESIRSRISELVSLYTARNLSALMDIIHRLPSSSPSPDTRRILTSFVIEALDMGSSLVPHGNVEMRPKSLRPPRLFLEQNIWDLLENALQKYASQNHQMSLTRAPSASLQSLLDDNQGYILIANTLQSVVSRLPEHQLKLAILHTEIPDAVYMALCSLWSTWLWKSENLPAVLRAYMGRRRIDPEWHLRDLTATLNDLIPALHMNASILCPITTNSITILKNVLVSLRNAGLSIDHWLDTITQGYRFTVVPKTPSEDKQGVSASQDYANTLAIRGEPCSMQLLQAAYLVEQSPADMENLPEQLTDEFVSLNDTGLVWLQDDSDVAKPLADRVEESTLQLLQQQQFWVRERLEAEIYALYRGKESPEPELVNTCINAYTIMALNHTLTLRPEDTPRTRRIELRESRTQVEQLGTQLGFNVSRRLNSDIVWKEPGKVPYLFRFSSTALLTQHLLNVSRMPSSERRCLVLPGGRASLVALKLRRDPRLQEAVTRDNWVFIKFRHLRRMLSEIKHRGEIDFYLGLDPIVEMDTAQIPLPLI